MILNFQDAILEEYQPDLHPYLRHLETVTSDFAGFCQDTLILQRPENDPHRLYDYYLDALLAVYFNKYHTLCASLIQALNAQNYLMYGLIGRAMIEHTAILRYYVTSKMLPLAELALEDGKITEAEVEEIIPWIEKHLTGQRFNWSEFLADYFGDLDHMSKANSEASQVNILTCLEKWIKDNPNIGPLYGLFSDLVHPNLGSTLLISRVVDKSTGIGGNQGEAIGLEIVQRTLPELLSIFQEVQEQLTQIQAFKFSQALRVKD